MRERFLGVRDRRERNACVVERLGKLTRQISVRVGAALGHNNKEIGAVKRGSPPTPLSVGNKALKESQHAFYRTSFTSCKCMQSQRQRQSACMFPWNEKREMTHIIHLLKPGCNMCPGCAAALPPFHCLLVHQTSNNSTKELDL